MRIELTHWRQVDAVKRDIDPLCHSGLLLHASGGDKPHAQNKNRWCTAEDIKIKGRHHGKRDVGARNARRAEIRSAGLKKKEVVMCRT